MLLLALSCLQGRKMDAAAGELLSLGVDGLQLTPGNLPTANFDEVMSSVNTLRHHGFSFDARRAPVWDDAGRCIIESDSVHPPKSDSKAASGWKDFVLTQRPDLVIETMYPSYELGDGPELEWAMNAGLNLAVDVSHLYLQRCAGVLSNSTLAKVLDYENIAEVHVSHNAGRADTHRPLEADTFGLAWAKEQLAAGTPVVLESYFHRITTDERQRQLDLILT